MRKRSSAEIGFGRQMNEQHPAGPPIVRVRLPGGVTHFVVIAGKDGFDYLVRDPGAGAAKGLYPLRELGSEIEALRFYEPIANANSQVTAKR